jgi:hypothetical protein
MRGDPVPPRLLPGRDLAWTGSCPCQDLSKAAERYTAPPSTMKVCAVTIRLSSAASHNTIRAMSGG